MIRSIFIANRGEIAVRVIRACRELGIESVIAYSEADKDSYPVQLADKRICVGPAPSSLSYLNFDNIISAAVGQSCNAIHPGVGFLSENAHFAREVQKAGIKFIGPDPDTIALVGDKIQAKREARKANVPCIPGSKDVLHSTADVRAFIKEYGYPVILKAASGGGGKGMRVIHDDSTIESSYALASSEAEKSFSDKRLFVEKYLTQPKHVEVQLMGDKDGNIVHLGERDCTVQLRHQKLIEESPSPSLNDQVRKKMAMSAVSFFRSLHYKNAGTVEFLVEGDEFYFMEVNARVQVEHPVSELVSDVDIIKEQIRIAEDNPLSVRQEDIDCKGYAMECRINALSPGCIETLVLPGGHGVRIDSWIRQGSIIPPFYDSLLMKLLVRAKDREEGIQKMLRALHELRLEGKGFSSNKEWFIKILRNSTFRSGNYSINYLEDTKILDETKA